MRRTLFALTLSCLFTQASVALAEDDFQQDASIESDDELIPPPAPSPRYNRITIGALPLIAGHIPLEYERALGNSFSFSIGPRATVPGITALMGMASVGLNLNLGVRYYAFAKSPMDGLWFGPETFGGFTSHFTRGSSHMQIAAGVHAMVGYTRIWQSGFTLSAGFGLGGGLAVGSARSSVGSSSGAYLMPSANVHANVGYAF